ncbi:TPA: ABC transporter permease [Streptococcus suis]|nr:ABC transporter permease [Streptococcus suis]NQO40300.1 ABC transporter permease [Streptococcus suis]NQP22494.1 ABC transporter permease [Streptococcus suis]NQP24461.1 ABC transporter permease [Streptococcus suis]HEL1738836.1 ABC transporter permease [Streptococcus suis]
MNLLNRENQILLKEMVKTDFKLRYQGSVIGYLWSILKPLMLFAIMYVVFIHFLRLGGDVPHFPVALLLGNVIWSFFSEATNMGMVSIVNRGDLLRKLNFPKEIIVLSSIFGAAINFSINLVVVLIFSIFNGVQFSWTILLAIPLFLELFLLATGIAFILSTFFVRFRDLSQIWEVIMQAGMYATPIIYSLSFVMNQSELAAKLIMLNPMAQIIQDMRYFVIDKANLPVWQVISNKAIVLIPYLIPIIVFVIGVNVFNKHSKKFAEIL